MKYVKAFFAFWYDFIVGDAWEVAAGVLIVLLLLFVGARTLNGGVGAAGVYFLPLAITGLLLYSLWRARKTG